MNSGESKEVRGERVVVYVEFGSDSEVRDSGQFTTRGLLEVIKHNEEDPHTHSLPALVEPVFELPPDDAA